GPYKDGNYLITNYSFSNNHGLNLLESKSTQDTHGNSISTTFTYNYYGSSISSGTNEKGVTQIVVDPHDGAITYKNTDASGKLVSSSDNGGVLFYSYFSNGKTKDIRLNSTSNPPLDEMTYDPFGFQATLHDKDAGSLIYTYDAF